MSSAGTRLLFFVNVLLRGTTYEWSRVRWKPNSATSCSESRKLRPLFRETQPKHNYSESIHMAPQKAQNVMDWRPALQEPCPEV
ncbi:hypothetical protein GOODEAATRI_030736 [Goodea atripinnis]|uniref:Secreted protein n=1 Tax=Goodea atripinnis TaxID=208336 RepID=A0ABV0NZ70_9TELE